MKRHDREAGAISKCVATEQSESVHDDRTRDITSSPNIESSALRGIYRGHCLVEAYRVAADDPAALRLGVSEEGASEALLGIGWSIFVRPTR